MGVVIAAVTGAELWWLGQTGATLTPDALVIRGIRKRVVPWRDIWWIGPYRQLGTDGVGVRTADDLYRLRAPVHAAFFAPDPEFATKARTIHDYWVAYRGADWRPPASPWWPPDG